MLALIIVARKGLLVALLRMNLPILLFFLYAGFSAFWSDFPDITARRWVKAVGGLLIVMVVLSERDRDSVMRRVLVWGGFCRSSISVLLI